MMHFCHDFVPILANNADPDGMPHIIVAFHLDLHCYQSTCLQVSRLNRVKECLDAFHPPSGF